MGSSYLDSCITGSWSATPLFVIVFDRDPIIIKRLGNFFQNVILFSNVVHHKCNIFYMQLVQYNECLISIVDADGLVL